MMVFIVAALALLSLGYASSTGSRNEHDFQAGLIDHTKYHRYNEIVNLLTGLQNSYGTSGVAKGSLEFQSAEGRDIPFVSVTGGRAANKKRIFIEAGLHAREWIAPAAALYFLDRLLERRDVDSDASYLFNNVDWFVVPLVNPDGYEYSHLSERFWRKNRRYMYSPECHTNMHGVDLNRNFDADWGNAGSSPDCAADTYHGPSVFSEPESWGVRNKVWQIQRDEGAVSAYIALQAYGEKLFTPYGFNDSKPLNYAQIMSITNKAREAILSSTGKDYEVGTPAEIAYSASGSASDWAILKGNIPYSLSMGLRPAVTDSAGFELPTSEIVPTGNDVWAALYAIATNLQ